MSALSTTTSHSTCDKKIEEGFGKVIAVADSSLPVIDEDDVDEGAKLAGEVATVFTQEEKDAVRRKLDRRVSSNLFLRSCATSCPCSPLPQC